MFARTNNLSAVDPVTQEMESVKVTDSPTPGSEFDYSKAAVGDFNGDGFPDVAIASKNGLRIVTANDPHNPSAGIRLGSYANLFYSAAYDLSIAVGDFNGDGRPEIAVADLATLAIYTVDPKTLAPT